MCYYVIEITDKFGIVTGICNFSELIKKQILFKGIFELPLYLIKMSKMNLFLLKIIFGSEANY